MATIYGTAGEDQLVGTVGEDLLDAGAGNDTLLGDQGADTYVFGYGYGHDRIFNEEPEQAQAIDRILLNSGVSPDDVVLSAVTLDAQGNPIPESLLLTLRSTGETLLVYSNYASSPNGYLNAAIDSIEFADGTVWNWMEIDRRSHEIVGTPGDDVLVGSSGDNLIMAGAGNDVLDGGTAGHDGLMGESGSDVYVFGYGSGHDTVYNYEPEWDQSIDRIRLNPGVAPADVELRVVTVDARGFTIPASLLLTLRSTGETLLVREQFETTMGTPTTSAVDFIEFADGTVWDQTQIRQLSGYATSEIVISGTPGDDVLYGTALDEVMDGGAGNDYLNGWEGSDIYVFGYGYGHDRISNGEPESNLSIDRIRLLPGVTPEDVELREVVQDVNGFLLTPSLQLRLRSTGETLIVLDSVEGNLGNNAIDFIEFADGTVWDKDEIMRRARLVEGTPSDDFLVGSVLANVLDGGAGNDLLIGGEGSDTYMFGQGYGHDQIDNWEPDNNLSFDRILLKPDVTVADVEVKRITADSNGMAIPPSLLLRLRSTGETLLVRDQFFPYTNESANPAIDFIEFADGTIWDRAEIERRANLIEGTAGDDWLVGSQDGDVIDGGAGNDHLNGDLGSDTYLFGLGSGHDVIYNHEPEGVYSSDRILLKPEVTTADVGLRVVTMDANGMGIPPSLQLKLRSTGETVTVMSHFDPAVWGEAAITTIEFADGTVWDRAEIERRAHLFEGTAGDDWILATGGNDVLDGGAGNDHLNGDLGSDTYVFGQGSGHDVIYNHEPEGMFSSDRILLKPEVTTADVELRIVTVDANGMGIPPSLQLRLKSTGETVTVMSHFDPVVWGEAAITTVEFADGTVWDRTEIERRVHLFEGSAGDDWILATGGNDVLDGGAGNDHLNGDLGSDTYVFGQGSGHDVIYNHEPEGAYSSDRILLKPEVTAADVELRIVTVDANGMDIPPSLQLRLKSTGETVTVMSHFDPAVWGEAAITTVEFADGTVWDRAEIERRAHLFEGTAGDDWILATEGNDVLDGGAGNDWLLGGMGSDTYVFGQGYGHDTIHDNEPQGMTSPDRILLKPGVTTADVELRIVTVDATGWSIPPSLQLRLRSTGESVTVLDHFVPMVWGETAITTIEFADGTVWDTAEIERRAHLFEGTAGDDQILGSDGNDVLDGGAGNDELMGGLGSDTYVFGQGSGHDLINSHEPIGQASNDRILLKPEVTVADVELRAVMTHPNGWDIPAFLQLKLKSTGETLTVWDHFGDGAWGETAITTIEFADSTVWDRAEIERRSLVFEGTAGDDVIMATGANNVLDGGAGNDQLSGSLGSDTYVFGYGSGQDRIDNHEPAGQTSSDRILLKPEVMAADVELRVVTLEAFGGISPSLQLKLRSTGETVTVLGHFDPAVWGEAAITTIEFADGTVWDRAEIERRTHLFEGTAGDDVITATEGNDVLDGGAGNDQLLGSLGSDTYVFGQGYGHDVIYNQELEGQTSTDRILLKPGITPLGVKLEVVAQDQTGAPIPDSLLLRVLATGETLLVRDHFVLSPNGSQLSAVDSIEFADGTVWDRATIDWRARLIEGTAGDDVLTGTARNDVLDGGAGDDTMKGGLGDDTYVVNRSGDRVVEASGAGTDTVLSSVSHTLASNVENLTLTGNETLNGDGNGLNNVLFGNDGNNLLNGLGGHDVLNGGSGNDRLNGGSGNDTLAGGLGADVLLGGSGNDVYQFGRGDGTDVVQDTGGNADVMSFLSGIEADQLWFRKAGSSLEISVIGTADKVTLSGWYSAYRIEEFKTADGKTLLDNDVHNLVQAMAAFAPPAAGQTTLPESYASTLNPVIAANWQ